MIARNTDKFQFITLDKYGEEVEWLHHFLEDIPKWLKNVPAINSQSAIGRTLNNMYNDKSSHIRHRHKIIRQLISTELIFIDYVKSKDNVVVDPLIKGLNRKLVDKSLKGMKLKPIRLV